MSEDQSMIQASEQIYTSCNNYKYFDFSGLYNADSKDNDFTSRRGFTFTDRVGRLYLTGNDLLYYPDLAVKLREIKEYPLFERVYPVNRRINGMAFIEYFYTHAVESFQAFQAELAKGSNEINALLDLYGNRRKTPLIDCVEVINIDSGSYKKLVINGVSWYLNNSYGAPKLTERINLEKLFNISSEFDRVELEAVAIGTPFIALRLGKTWKHRGHVNWYSLDTRQLVSKSEVPKK